MTEKTFFWTHGGGGDASYSPYDASEFNLYQFMPLVGEGSNEAYIVPGYLEDLKVEVVGTGLNAVVVRPGAAILDNYLYVSDEDVVIPLDYATTGKVRKDVIVLRFVNTDNKPKVRLGVVQGVESTSTPTTPVMTQTTSLFEVPLAVCYISEYNSVLTSNYLYVRIVDKRKFIYTLYTKQKYAGKIGNLLENSEFLGFSYEGTALKVPDHWIFLSDSAGTSTLTRPTLSVGSGRSNLGISLTTNTSLNMFQTVWIHESVYTVYGYYEKTNAAGDFYITFDYYDSSEKFIKRFETQFPAEALTEDGYFQITFKTPSNVSYVHVIITLHYATVSQLILVEGYHPASSRPINEIIMFTHAITDASWTNTAKSTGTTTINLGVSFGALIKNYTKSVILRLRGNDSGSAAAVSCYLRALGYAAPFNSVYGELDIGGVVNDIKRDTTAIVPVDQIYYATGAAGVQFRLEVLATGAGTFDASVEIVGIII